jgi:hypothetical protein
MPMRAYRFRELKPAGVPFTGEATAWSQSVSIRTTRKALISLVY